MYISLHNHSDGSLMDGYQTCKEMVTRAKELGYSALSLTDHGTMRNIIRFYKECKAQDIKPIVGCEFYFTPDITIRDRAFTHHLVLMAMNEEGYMNLKKLDSRAYREEAFYFKPRIDYDDLKEYNAGIICLTACMASIINTDAGEEWFQKYKEIFGDRFYAEIQPLDIAEQQCYNNKVIDLARKYDVPLVVTTDAHYSRKEEERYHQLWVKITNKRGYKDTENYLWSEEELRQTSWIPEGVKEEAIANTAAIADRCDVEIELKGNHYPKYPVDNPAEKIREICRETWRAKVPKGQYAKYGEQFNKEMADLEKVGYLNYLLIIWDLVAWCVKNNIPVGEGRGSAAGCLVGYLLGIHKIDPLKYGTEFFRFCNVERQSPADIDTDVSTRNRSTIIDYIRNHYGTVCKVATLGYTKNPDKDEAGKEAVLKAWQALSNAHEDEPEKWAPAQKILATKSIVDSIDDIRKAEILLTDEDKEELIDVAKHFCGRLDKQGVHASAILVTPDAIENYCPVEGCRSNNTATGETEYIRVAAYEFHTLEDMGCLKLDILGLNTLDIIDECLSRIDDDIDLENIPMDDKATYECYASGELSGIFQMESPGMRKIAKELHVSKFSDVAALVALYRPGPLDSGMLQQYIDAKNGKIKVEYPCKEMKTIAGSTYGVLVYQEEIMKISMAMAGYSLGEADALRKVIGRKEITKIDAAVKEFVERCMAKGHSKEVAENVANQIKAAGRYVFNKAHAVSYGRLSYKTAYLKTHYPVQYCCALLNSKSKQEDVLPYIDECKRLGIEILPPDFSVGNRRWEVEGDSIRVGLTYIKAVGKNLKTTDDNGNPLKTWEDIVKANNKRILEGLIKAGALDFLGKSRGWLIANLETTQDLQKKREHYQERIEHYTFERDNASDAKTLSKANRLLEQWQVKLADLEFAENAETKYDAAAGEMEVLSFSFAKLPKVLHGTAKMVHEFTTKNGYVMAMVTFATDYGEIKGSVAPFLWKRKERFDRLAGRKIMKGFDIVQGNEYDFMIKKDGQYTSIIDAKKTA